MIESPPPPPSPTPTIVAARELLITKVPAHLSNYSRVVRTPVMVVVHATDGCEGTHCDMDGALEIAHELPQGKKRSFHYIVDADSAANCVDDTYTAFHCRHRGNAIGLGVELCGRAKQSRAEWCDPVSLATLQNGAYIVAMLCVRWNIPAILLDAAALRSGNEHGITTHAAISEAWHESNHTDPGPHFPLLEFVHAVRMAMGVSKAPVA